jgi:hypothetical protein
MFFIVIRKPKSIDVFVSVKHMPHKQLLSHAAKVGVPAEAGPQFRNGIW